MSKILLIAAPRPDSNETAMHMGDGRPPMGLAYISAYVEKFGHETKIIDLYHFGGGHIDEQQGYVKASATISHIIRNDKPYDVMGEIEKYNPDVIGMYLGTISYYEGTKLALEIKQKYPNTPIMVGGPHAIELPETLTPYFDYVVCGEGERAAMDIIEGKAEKGIVRRANIDDINLLPLPDFRHFIHKPYNWELEMFENEINPVITINSTRGCPFSCMFCGVANTKFRGIDADRLVNYIGGLVDSYGAEGIYFREDNFTVQPKRVEKFCDLLISENLNINWACESRVNNLSPKLIEKMAKSGCVGLYIGTESGSERMLKYMRKGETKEDFIEKLPIIHANGLTTYTTWVFGLPTETEKDRDDTRRFIDLLKPTTADTFVYLGQPGSDFYKMLDTTETYEFKEKNGLFYVPGFIPLAKQVYGENDPRVEFVETLYEKNKVNPGPLEPYYIDEELYRELATKKVRSQLSVKEDPTEHKLMPALSRADTNTYESV
jgi:radical SAM superfamily enzyme YgiQ (UPF0313 family)